MLHICLSMVVGRRGAWQQLYWCTHDESTWMVARGPGEWRHANVRFQETGGTHVGVHWRQRKGKPEHVNTCEANKMLPVEKCE